MSKHRAATTLTAPQLNCNNFVEDLHALWREFVSKYPTTKTLIKYSREQIDRRCANATMGEILPGRITKKVDTNNLIESWHTTLKRRHLGHECNVRVIYLSYLLQGVARLSYNVLQDKEWSSAYYPVSIR
ncbi:hypothetical protein EDD21DRAFT_357627 [Dissophora ornata]|nr:hypothetical protein EDD21DRAFT_357627 [Dissophora ornata]